LIPDHDEERRHDEPPARPRYARGPWLPPAEPPSRRSLAETLEAGPLRSELGGDVAQPDPAEPARIARFAFTGDGAEYFRIWVVNLLLTLATLGIYSAWAKVRKTRYFWQNTRLDGHAFDYHGDPRAILLGRAIAVVLLVAYTFAFDVSRNAGLTVIVLLCLVGPWLFMRAQRFKLVNTSWRGLRFGFEASTRDAYRVVLPPLVIWFSSTVVTALASERVGLFSAAGAVSVVLLPWMHHRLKAYQHDRARFGERRFGFISATPGFYAVYFKAGLLSAAAVAIGGSMLVAAFALAAMGEDDVFAYFAAVAAIVVGIVGYLVAWPYFAARLQAVVWGHTRMGDVHFGTAIRAGPLFKLTLKNVLLTLVTAGLYWPFAAVALARYRVECMRAESDEPLVSLAEATRAAPGLAAGDAALDAFGLDIGL
jgi:uncharacterized membrane protein YjgN (DUF898 family)